MTGFRYPAGINPDRANFEDNTPMYSGAESPPNHLAICLEAWFPTGRYACVADQPPEVME